MVLVSEIVYMLYKNPTSTKHNNRGFSLLEMALVVAVMAVIGFIAVRHYQGVSASNKANTTVQIVQHVHAAIVAYSQDRNVYPSSTDTLIKAGYLSNVYRDFPWGQPVLIGTPAGRADNTYAITIYNIPSDAMCRMIYNRIKSSLNTEGGEYVSYWNDREQPHGPVNPEGGCSTVTVFYPSN